MLFAFILLPQTNHMYNKRYLLGIAILLCSFVASASNNQKYHELHRQYDEYFEIKDYANSARVLEEALTLIHSDSLEMFSDTYNGLTYSYWCLGKYEKALDYGSKALDIDRQLGDSAYISSSLALISAIFTHQNMYAEAETYMNDALGMVPKDDIAMLASRHGTLGEILTLEEKYEEAIYHIEYAYSLDTAGNRIERAAMRLSQLGNTYIYVGEYAKAEKALATSTAVFRETCNWHSLCINLLQQSKLYTKINDPQKARTILNECLEISRKTSQRPYEYKATYMLAKLLRDVDLYQKAMDLKDSLHNEQIQSQVAEFEVKYETAEKERQNAQLQIVIERQHHLMWILIIVLIAIMGGVALTLVLYRLHRDIQRTESIARKLFFPKTRKQNENTTSPDSVTADEELVINAKPSILSAREIEIVRACCQGKLSKEIADELCISKRTVDAHKTTIYQKLGVSNNTELILYAVKNGLVHL